MTAGNHPVVLASDSSVVDRSPDWFKWQIAPHCWSWVVEVGKPVQAGAALRDCRDGRDLQRASVHTPLHGKRMRPHAVSGLLAAPSDLGFRESGVQRQSGCLTVPCTAARW